MSLSLLVAFQPSMLPYTFPLPRLHRAKRPWCTVNTIASVLPLQLFKCLDLPERLDQSLSRHDPLFPFLITLNNHRRVFRQELLNVPLELLHSHLLWLDCDLDSFWLLFQLRFLLSWCCECLCLCQAHLLIRLGVFDVPVFSDSLGREHPLLFHPWSGRCLAATRSQCLVC